MFPHFGGSYPTYGTILPLFNPRFVPLNAKIFENEFQIQILHPKTRLGAKLHRNGMIFIFCLFGGSYPLYVSVNSKPDHPPQETPGDSHILVAPGVGFSLFCLARGGLKVPMKRKFFPQTYGQMC